MGVSWGRGVKDGRKMGRERKKARFKNLASR